MFSHALLHRLASKAQPLPSQSNRFSTICYSFGYRPNQGVSVTKYTESLQQPSKGAQRAMLHVDPKQQASLEAKDEARKAVPFDRSLLSKLTPTMKSFMLDGKVALVTGGARGLGWNISQALAEAGASAIALLDIKQELADVRNATALAEVMSRVVHDLGSIDIVVNSAGVVDSNIKAETYDANKFRTLLDINLTGSFLVSQAAAREMMRISSTSSSSPSIEDQGEKKKNNPPQPPPSTHSSGSHHSSGITILLSSIASTRVLHPQQQCAYNASKAAVSQLARSLAAEWAPAGIRVNTIAPGYMDTALNEEAQLNGQKGHWCAMTPMGRLGGAGELNGVAVFLASDAAGFVTGAEVLCDGGYACY